MIAFLRRWRSPGPGLDPERPAELGLAFGERFVPATVRRNARARRLILRMAPDGSELRVTAPGHVSERAIGAFLERQRGWVEARLSRAAERVLVAPGVVLPLRGVPTRLAHEPALRAPRPKAGEEGEETTLVFGGGEEHFARRVRDHLKREARGDLAEAVERHARAVGLKPRAITLRDTRSRWGSCTADRRLSFSWRIVMAPPPILDYLAAHEVAHFVEMNHGADFWALCAKLCAHTEESKVWLKRHGTALQAIRFEIGAERI